MADKTLKKRGLRLEHMCAGLRHTAICRQHSLLENFRMLFTSCHHLYPIPPYYLPLSSSPSLSPPHLLLPFCLFLPAPSLQHLTKLPSSVSHSTPYFQATNLPLHSFICSGGCWTLTGYCLLYSMDGTLEQTCFVSAKTLPYYHLFACCWAGLGVWFDIWLWFGRSHANNLY